MIIEEIESKLKEIDKNVFYGAVKRSIKDTLWNYIVFDRGRMKKSTNGTGYSYTYNVHVVREDYIPEGLEIDVINKIEEITGMRYSGEDAEYTYTVKPNTNVVVEMVTLTFVKPVKKV